MTKKTLKCNNIRVNKKEFHMSQELIDLMSLNIDQIVIFDKFNHNNNNNVSRYFIGYQKKVKLLNHYVLFYLQWVGI